MTDTDVRAAELEAGQAAQRLAELEHQVLHEPPDRRPAAAAVVEQAHLAEFARKRVQIVEERAHRASAAQRLADLGEVGEKVDDLAAEAQGPAAAIRAAQLQAICATAQDFKAGCEAHDATVRALTRWASSLKLVNVVGGHGPHPENGNVEVTGPPPTGGIAHGLTTVATIARLADRALDAALAGKVDDALALVAPVRQHQPRKMDHTYEVIASGQQFSQHGDPDRAVAERLIAGTIAEVGE
jgi:hypothetical protein